MKVRYDNLKPFDIEVKLQVEKNSRFGASAPVRIYMHGQPSPDEVGTGVHPESYESNPENNLLWKAYNKAEVKIMKEALDVVKYDILKLLREEIHFQKEGNFTFQFDKKAGCNCGCSPGFKLKKDGKVVSNYNGTWPKAVSIYVSLSNEDTRAEDEKKAILAKPSQVGYSMMSLAEKVEETERTLQNLRVRLESEQNRYKDAVSKAENEFGGHKQIASAKEKYDLFLHV